MRGRYHTGERCANARSVQGLPFCRPSRTNGARPLMPSAGAPMPFVPPRRRTILRSMPMLISPAYAQSSGMSGLMDQSALVQFLPLALIFVVFYFLLIRPQQQKQKQHRAMIDALRRGDRIVTGGGVLGTVSKVVGPEEVEVDIASGFRARVWRSPIAGA